MTKVSTLMAFATFLVVGINYSASVSPEDQRLAVQQCREQLNNAAQNSCLWACLLEKWGMVKDRKLVGREKAYDIIVDTLRHERFELKDGKTSRQLAEKCYDEANRKTDECEMAIAMRNCLRREIDHGRPKLPICSGHLKRPFFTRQRTFRPSI